MSTEKKLLDCLEQIRTVESNAKSFYEDFLPRLKDPELSRMIIEIKHEEARHVQIAEELLRIAKKYENISPEVFAVLKGISLPILYSVVGFFLGLGAPVGALLSKVAFVRPASLEYFVSGEWELHGWYYLYMGVGSTIVFSLFGMVAGIFHAHWKNRSLHAMNRVHILEHVTGKDSLTGLHNFSYISERLDIEIERSKRFGTPLSCLMIDLDNLKTVNDVHGHLAGNLVISYVAKCIQKEIRVIDTPSRYGGDEFFVILPVTPVAGARVVAERIRKKIMEGALSYHGMVLKPTVSIGVGTFPSACVYDADSLVAAADHALYHAKTIGKNMTIESDLLPNGRVKNNG